MKIGFIGLGTIGGALARNLIKAGHDLAVFDLDLDRIAEMVLMGARPAASIAEAARDCEALMTSLPGPAQVETVMAEAGPVMPAGAVWVDLTTSDVTLTRRIAADLARRNIATLESPITGGVKNAHLGRITIFVAGDRAAYDRVRPVLMAMAGEVFYFGDVGGATVVKLITNFVAFVHCIALGEGLIFGKKYGIEINELIAAMKSSYADSFVLQTDVGKILSGDYATDFALGLACKDLRLAHGMAQEMGLRLDITELTGKLYAEALETFGPQAGSLAPILLAENRTGIALSDQMTRA